MSDCIESDYSDGGFEEATPIPAVEKADQLTPKMLLLKSQEADMFSAKILETTDKLAKKEDTSRQIEELKAVAPSSG